MKICRFSLKNDASAAPRVGVMEGDVIRDVTAVLDELPAMRWPLPPGDQFFNNFDHLRPRMEAMASAPGIACQAIHPDMPKK